MTEECKLPDVAQPIEGFVWIGPKGQWLTYYENTTHTSTHKRLGETNDLAKAYVGAYLPRYNEPRDVRIEQFIKIRAQVLVVRTVTLVKEPDAPMPNIIVEVQS